MKTEAEAEGARIAEDAKNDIIRDEEEKIATLIRRKRLH